MAVDFTQRLAQRSPMALGFGEEGETFALLLRRYRKAQGLTQEELAGEWNYSFETISAWEREKRFPARPEMPRLAHLLDMDIQVLGEVVRKSRPRQGKTGEQVRKLSGSTGPVAEVPFEQGRLFWTLHLGVECGRLQCLITCPLASGETWKVPLDSVTDAETIRLVHQVIHEHISKGAHASSVQTGGNA